MEIGNGIRSAHDAAVLRASIATIEVFAGAFSKLLDDPRNEVILNLEGHENATFETSIRRAPCCGTTPQPHYDL